MKSVYRVGMAALVLTLVASVQAAPESEKSYDASRWDPIHFKPAIEQASNEQCLSCHQEIRDRRVLETSPAGVRTSDTLAWYQTLETYTGDQETFHRRHLETEFANEVMDLKCNTCHQGNDPREETANSSATGDSTLIQRKHVDPQICLMCHGRFPSEIMGIPGSWPDNAQLFADNCLTCHAAIRSNRHQVNFLKPKAIEEAGQKNSDVCYGCHGGRAWYRISFPYARHTWPGAGSDVPEWAKNRPTESMARFRSGAH